MNLTNLDENFKLLNQIDEDKEITDIYIGDLLSVVMGKAKEGNAWLTIQGHINIVAVALLTGVSCIIVCENSEVDANTIEKATNEEISVFSTPLSAFHAAKKLIELSGNVL